MHLLASPKHPPVDLDLMFQRILEAAIATTLLFGLAALLVLWVVRRALSQDARQDRDAVESSPAVSEAG